MRKGPAEAEGILTGPISKEEIEEEFRLLCEQAGRRGVIGFVPVEGVRLLPVQSAYLRRKLDGLGPWSEITAISVGLLYHGPEILAIPPGWVIRPPEDGHWNRYARAYTELNRLLDRIATRLAKQLRGVIERAAIKGRVGEVSHVNDYFSACVSHRAFAEAAGMGWRGKHGLVVTLEAGAALRFATIFISQQLLPDDKRFPGCGDCNACLEACPILFQGEGYRDRCRRRIETLGLEAGVCGICVRACWEAVKGSVPFSKR